jgi:hypothetical protein
MHKNNGNLPNIIQKRLLYQITIFVTRNETLIDIITFEIQFIIFTVALDLNKINSITLVVRINALKLALKSILKSHISNIQRYSCVL